MKKVIISAKNILALASLAAGLLSSGSSWPASWQPIAIKDAEIMLLVPGLQPDASKFERSLKGYRQFVEIGYWSGAGGYPVAELVLNYLNPTGTRFFASRRIPALDEQIRRWHPNRGLRLGASGSDHNVLGEFKYQRYSRDSVFNCVFISQFAGPTAEDGLVGGDSGNALGTMWIQGYYCAGPGDDLDERAMKAFFAGIGIRSWEIPKPTMGEQSTDGPAYTDSKTLKVAIFDTLEYMGSQNSEAEKNLLNFAHRYITLNDRLDLIYSYYGNKFDGIEPETWLWSGRQEHRPLADKVYSAGARIGADIVLMYTYGHPSFLDPRRFEYEAYLFDIKTKRAYQFKGDQKDYQHRTEYLFEQLIAVRD